MCCDFKLRAEYGRAGKDYGEKENEKYQEVFGKFHNDLQYSLIWGPYDVNWKWLIGILRLFRKAF